MATSEEATNVACTRTEKDKAELSIYILASTGHHIGQIRIQIASPYLIEERCVEHPAKRLINTVLYPLELVYMKNDDFRHNPVRFSSACSLR